MTTPNLRRLKDYVALVARGFCMGAADIVPGVSGGTMAFILGIYEELISSIRTFATVDFWRDICGLRIQKVIAQSNWQFLVSVAAGILLAVVSLSHSLEYLLETQPVLVWSFFFGLVLASVVVVARKIRRWETGHCLAALGGVVFAYLLVGLVPVETPDAPWFLVLSGAIAICAMILPGISGSFLLVILGKYEFILNAVNTRDFLSLGYVGCGAAVGILAFSHVLNWLLMRYHDLTVAFLTGLMIGSLRKVWPWKDAAELNIVPQPGIDLAVGIALILLGAGIVLLIEKLAAE